MISEKYKFKCIIEFRVILAIKKTNERTNERTRERERERERERDPSNQSRNGDYRSLLQWANLP